MTLPIVSYGHPALRMKGAPVRRIDDDLRKLVADMLETMYEANGVGLAAQQVGLPLQLCVIDVNGMDERPSVMRIGGQEVDPAEHMPMVCINPVLKLVPPNETGPEGCLSFPDIGGEITRPARVQATITRLDGSQLTFEAEGLLSRALQHEVDHLNGILFIDRMKPRDRAALKGKLARLKREGEEEARAMANPAAAPLPGEASS
jgi:peptide deformylase